MFMMGKGGGSGGDGGHGGGGNHGEGGDSNKGRDRKEKSRDDEDDDINDGRWWVGGEAPEVATPEVRSRTIVLTGCRECTPALDRKKILEVLGPSPCYKDVEIFRGTQETPIWFPTKKTRPYRNVLKVRFKTAALAEAGRSCFKAALTKLGALYVRFDMTLEQLMYDARLRKKCQELNRGLRPKKYVVVSQRIVERGTLRPYVENSGAEGPSSFIQHGFGKASDSTSLAGSTSSASSWTFNEPLSVVPSFGNAIGDIENTKEKFAVSVDVGSFKQLKMGVKGRELTIKVDHEERQESGWRISPSFVYKYMLPEGVTLEELCIIITKEGKLTIEASKRAIKGP